MNHEHGTHVIDRTSGTTVFAAPSAHSLIQAAGYLKHTRALKNNKGVFFRGQTQIYKSLCPTLLRGTKEGPPAQRRRQLLTDYLKNLDSSKRALRAVNTQCREALLQHYGLRTTWIDVVDNIWVALWFACHYAKGFPYGEDKYLHFEKRVPHIKHGEPEYAYVLLVESAYFGSDKSNPGYYRDDRSETIDLRVAVPSQFVRPHAQHGILIRRLSKKGHPVCDFSPMHIGTIRVELASALDWLGTAATLTSHSLFPPAYYDYGYRELLEHVRPTKKLLGSIHRVQA